MNRPVMVAKTSTLRAPGGLLRTLALVLGGTAIAAGFQLGLLWLTVPGGIMVGWAIQPDADRFYLEGFGDGLDAGTKLMADATDEAERMGGGGAGVREPHPGAGAGAARVDQWAAGAATPIPRERGADGEGGGARPARPAFTDDGRPIPASGPRPSLLPDLPEVVARGTRSVDLQPQDRAAPGGPHGDSIGSDRVETEG